MSAVTDRFCERKSEPTIRATRSPRLAEEQNEQSLFRSFPTLPSPCDCDRANKAPEGLGWGNTAAQNWLDPRPRRRVSIVVGLHGRMRLPLVPRRILVKPER